jgi:transcription elongation factor GreA
VHGKSQKAREETLASFILRFAPHFQEEVMAGIEQRFSRSSYERLTQELENLKGQRAKVVEDIKEAREQGDLRENFAYHDAKNAQGILEARIAGVEARLANAVIVEGDEAGSEVMMGVPVKINFLEQKRMRTYTIVTEEELDEVDGGASADSPIGVALLGKKVGDVVEIEGPNGLTKVEVLSVGE